MSKIEGPYERVTRMLVCNMCQYLNSSMRSRGGPGKNSDYWRCAHPSNPSSLGGGRPISTGTGNCPTPSWCPCKPPVWIDLGSLDNGHCSFARHPDMAACELNKGHTGPHIHREEK